MANEPVDPLRALTQALAAPADSKEQADLLATLRESLEAYPHPIPVLCTTLLRTTVSAPADSLLKRWFLDLLHFAIARSSLSLEARTQLSAQSLDVLAGLLNDPSPFTVKVVIQCFAALYPLLFRMLCTNRNQQQRAQWAVLTQSKTRILEHVWASHSNAGVRFAAIKFMQRIILVQTKGVSDPRLQNKNDPNLSMCPTDHPFIPTVTLEAESFKLLEGIITLLFSTQNPDVVSAIVNSWSQLAKLRPSLVELIVSTLASWTPAALAGLPATQIKSVEKAVRILLTHISRTPQGHLHVAQIRVALDSQAARMDAAAAEERQRKVAATEASRKRSSAAPTPEGPDAKRVKLESESGGPPSIAFLAGFDFTTLSASLVTELIVANLEAFSESALVDLVQTYRSNRATAQSAAATVAPTPISPMATLPLPANIHSETSTPPIAPSRSRSPPLPAADASAPSRSRSPPKAPAAMLEVKEEPVDPLQMDIDEEEFDYEPERLNLELSGGEQEVTTEADIALDHEMDLALDPAEFKLPPPKELDDDDRTSLIRASLVRIWDGAKDLQVPEMDWSDSPGMSASDLWMLLLVRLITRVVDPTPPGEPGEGSGLAVSELYARQDRLRQTLCDYIMDDFSGRVRLATTWMNEEWYNDQVRTREDPDWNSNYDTWLNQIVAVYQTHADGKDRTFSRFLLDLPSVPIDVMALLRDMCVDFERRNIGFTTLREFVQQRPTLRVDAMNVLLELTTHSDKVTRIAAINTVKRWIPDSQPMEGMIRDFALQLLRRLQSRPKSADKDSEPHAQDNDPDSGMEEEEDGQLPPEEIIQTPYLPGQLELPATNAQVLQHVELLLALSTKVPDLLDELFAAYGGMDESVQETIQQLVTPLVRALGQNHGKLLNLLRTFPRGAETLALRVLNIFTESGRPSPSIVTLVKTLVSDRDLDARFLIPIIAEMDKTDILRHLPRIVSVLNGKPEPRNLVRSVFSSIVTTPPQTFGTVTSNLPRVRQSELLSPAELMVLIHESEKEIGLKSAIEAIGICFSMTDIFRSEILGVVMNLLVDAPFLPTLFMRTVIQAVTTYRTLIGFVSTTLLSRLITKKIWTAAPLWEGFIRCAKLTAPSSFPSLLQLPKDQLQELVNKQPSLKSGLREYVTKKDGYKARLTGLLDILGEDDPSSVVGSGTATPQNGGEDSIMGTPVPPVTSDVQPSASDTPQPEIVTPS